MLGMYVEYSMDGYIERGEIISFLQTSPELLYIVKFPACPELVFYLTHQPNRVILFIVTERKSLNIFNTKRRISK